MSRLRIAAELSQIGTQPGIVACALVDAVTGLVWQATDDATGAGDLWEAAVEYWRMHRRHAVHFAGLGPLAAAVMYHADGVLAVLPCCADPEVLLVARGTHAGVDWVAVQRMARALGRTVESAR